MSDTDSIKQLYMDLCDASVHKDIDKLDEILADNYELIHMTGLHQSKEDYISSVKNGELKYYDSIHEEINVTINGDTASVVGKTKTLASPFGISKSWWNLRQDMIMKKIDSKWIITQSVASTY